jgi:AcrR family transcriptional regulator
MYTSSMNTDSSQTPTARQRAIAVALKQIRRHGFEKFRLSDVAKEMNVSHAALYRHFSSRDDLLDSINESWLVNEIDAALEDIYLSDLPPTERIIEWAVCLYRLKREKVRSDIEPYEALIDAMHLKKPYVQAHIQVTHKQLTSMVDQALEAKEIQGDPKMIVQVLQAAMHEYHYPEAVLQSIDRDREPELRLLLSLIFTGLQK